jgi:hypothetical protein
MWPTAAQSVLPYNTRTVTPLCPSNQRGKGESDCFSVDEKNLQGRSLSKTGPSTKSIRGLWIGSTTTYRYEGHEKGWLRDVWILWGGAANATILSVKLFLVIPSRFSLELQTIYSFSLSLV